MNSTRHLVAGLMVGRACPHVLLQASRGLFERGVDIAWIGAEDTTLPMGHFDGLVVVGEAGEDQTQPGLPVVRRFWAEHKSLAFFGSSEALLSAAQIVAPEHPGELQGVISDASGINEGALDEFVDALDTQPHTER